MDGINNVSTAERNIKVSFQKNSLEFHFDPNMKSLLCLSQICLPNDTYPLLHRMLTGIGIQISNGRLTRSCLKVTVMVSWDTKAFENSWIQKVPIFNQTPVEQNGKRK